MAEKDWAAPREVRSCFLLDLKTQQLYLSRRRRQSEIMEDLKLRKDRSASDFGRQWHTGRVLEGIEIGRLRLAAAVLRFCFVFSCRTRAHAVAKVCPFAILQFTPTSFDSIWRSSLDSFWFVWGYFQTGLSFPCFWQFQLHLRTISHTIILSLQGTSPHFWTVLDHS